jgi:hypothetical protein
VRGTETLPYDEAFAYVGLRLVRSPASTVQTPNTGQTRTREDYRLEEIKDAPAEARALRAAWLKGNS